MIVKKPRRFRPSDHNGRSHRSRSYFQKDREPTYHAIMSHEEIARELGISRQRVQAIESRALRKLRRARILREYYTP